MLLSRNRKKLKSLKLLSVKKERCIDQLLLKDPCFTSSVLLSPFFPTCTSTHLNHSSSSSSKPWMKQQNKTWARGLSASEEKSDMWSSNGSQEVFSLLIKWSSSPWSLSVSCRNKSWTLSLNKRIWTSFSTVFPRLVNPIQSRTGYQITIGIWSKDLSNYPDSSPSRIIWYKTHQPDSRIGTTVKIQKLKTSHWNGKPLKTLPSRNFLFSDVWDPIELVWPWPTSSETPCLRVIPSPILIPRTPLPIS